MPDQSDPYKLPWELPSETSKPPGILELVKYVKERLVQGVSRQTIEADVLRSGWTQAQIQQAFQQIQLPKQPIPSQGHIQPLPEKLLSGKILQWVFLSFFVSQFLLNLFSVISSSEKFGLSSISKALFFPSFTFWLPIVGSPLVWLLFFYAFFSYSRILIRITYILLWVLFVILVISLISLAGNVPYLDTISIGSRSLDGSLLPLIIIPLLIIVGVILYFMRENLSVATKIEQLKLSRVKLKETHTTTNSKLRVDTIIVRFLVSFLLLFFIPFFLGLPILILHTTILAFTKPELYDVVVQISNIIFYSSILIFGLTPIVVYLNKKYNYLIKFQLGLFLLVLLISAALIPIGIKKYNTPSDRIENPTEITVVDNILYILDEGERRTNIDNNPRETSNFIWSYRIPSGEFLSVDLSTSEKGIEKNKLIAKEPDEPLVTSNKAKIIRGDPDSLLVASDLGIKKTYTIKFKYIEAKNNKTGKINKLSSDGEVRMWSWGKSIYYLEMKINKNQVDIHKINVNTDKVTKIDSISGSGRPQPRLYNNELYIRFDSIRGEEPSENIFIFDLDQDKFIFESQISKDYTKLYNYNQNYFFLYGPDEGTTDRPDEVLMVNKITGDVIKFTGKSNAVN